MSAPPIISRGNIPRRGNSSQVIRWKAIKVRYAHGRERRQSSQATMVRSKSAPVQLMAYAVQVSCSSAPMMGMSPRW